MLLSDTGLELMECLGRQRDVPSLIAAFQRVVLAFGMDSFCIGDISHPRIKRDDRNWGTTWPAAAYARYVGNENMAKDPAMARANVQTTPFRWSEAFVAMDANGRQVLNDLHDFGMTDGFAVPVHHAHDAVHGVSIAAADYDLSPGDELALHMASLYLHARLMGMRTTAAPTRPAKKLTPRECECLKWVAAGKTDWEISQILNISEQTAHGYVQNALTKLNARTRAQAVALAIQSAQISP